MRPLLTLSVLLPMSTFALSARAQAPTTLAQLRDDFRPLLIFAASPDDPALLAQLHRLKDSAPGLTERNVLLIAIPFHNPSPTRVTLTERDAAAARTRFHILPTDFVVILLGKDGEEKLRSTRPLSFSRIQATIDAMPMRQQEMRLHEAH